MSGGARKGPARRARPASAPVPPAFARAWARLDLGEAGARQRATGLIARYLAHATTPLAVDRADGLRKMVKLAHEVAQLHELSAERDAMLDEAARRIEEAERRALASERAAGVASLPTDERVAHASADQPA